MKMKSIILQTLALSAVFAAIPEPKISLSTSGIEFFLDDVPGITFLEVRYNGQDKNFITASLQQTVFGTWIHRNRDFTIANAAGGIRYTLVGVENGHHVQFPVIGDKNWQPEPQSVMLPPKRVTRSGRVIFRDDFNKGSQPCCVNWDYEVSMFGGYNWEFQVYTNDQSNVYIKDGYLFLKPTLTSTSGHFTEAELSTANMDVAAIWGYCTNNDRYGCFREGKYGLLPSVQSAKLKSKHSIRYGKVEIRAKIPKGDWIWPAIWMLPKTSHYGGWPRSGEIDIMESRGNTLASDGSGANHGVNEVSSTLHWGPAWDQNRFSLTTGAKSMNGYWSSDFHVWTLDWTADYMTVSVDGNLVNTVPTPAKGFWDKGGFSGENIWRSGGQNAPFDQPFYLILNVAVGGNNGYFPDSFTYNTPKPWSQSSSNGNSDFWKGKDSWLPTWQGDDVAMQVDYVEMTQY